MDTSEEGDDDVGMSLAGGYEAGPPRLELGPWGVGGGPSSTTPGVTRERSSLERGVGATPRSHGSRRACTARPRGPSVRHARPRAARRDYLERLLC